MFKRELIGFALIAGVSLALAGPALGAEPPTVTKVEPGSGKESGGTTVTIHVTMTCEGPVELTAVKFGSSNAEIVKEESVDHIFGGSCERLVTITAVSPPGRSIVDVTVTAKGATSLPSTADRFIYMAPRFYVNGTLAGSGPVAGAGETNVVQFGTITMKSPFLGEIKCQALVGAPVSNESERGVAPVDGWETWNCRMPDCLKGSASVTAAKPLQLIQYENPKKEIVIEVIRPEPRTTLPWSAEMTERERFKLFRMGSTEKQPPAPVKFWVDCPGEGLEVPYEGELAPIVHNGTKNGLKPSQMEFEGNGGRTGHLLTPDICGGECEQADLFLSGQLTILGTMQQLVTAE